MKNKVIMFILTLFLFIPINVKANEWIYQENIDNHSYLGICSYENRYFNGATQRIDVYYNLSDKGWVVGWTEDALKHDKSGTFDFVFSSRGKNVTIDNNYVADLQRGVCPQEAWIVSTPAIRTCFGTKDFCSGFGSSIGADTSAKKVDLANKISVSFTAWWMNKKYTCSDVKDINVEKIIKEIKGIIIPSNYEFPDFMIKNPEFTKGLEYIKTKADEFIKTCNEQVVGNTNLTNEEKNNMLNQNQQSLQGFQNDIENFRNQNMLEVEFFDTSTPSSNISTPTGEKTNATLNRLCGNSKLQNAMKFIGFLLLIVKIMVPILLIIMGSIDYAKSIISGDVALGKSTSSLFKRVIAAIVIFLLPTIVNFIFSLAKNEATYNKCRECIFKPYNCN